MASHGIWDAVPPCRHAGAPTSSFVVCCRAPCNQPPPRHRRVTHRRAPAGASTSSSCRRPPRRSSGSCSPRSSSSPPRGKSIINALESKKTNRQILDRLFECALPSRARARAAFVANHRAIELDVGWPSRAAIGRAVNDPARPPPAPLPPARMRVLPPGENASSWLSLPLQVLWPLVRDRRARRGRRAARGAAALLPLARRRRHVRQAAAAAARAAPSRHCSWRGGGGRGGGDGRRRRRAAARRGRGGGGGGLRRARDGSDARPAQGAIVIGRHRSSSPVCTACARCDRASSATRAASGEKAAPSLHRHDFSRESCVDVCNGRDPPRRFPRE